MKIGIVSGRLEGVQVQLTLLNYLELWQQEEGRDYVEWKYFLEYTLDERVLLEFDIIFFVRSKSFKALYMMQYCQQQGLKTVYILDDNWFCEEVEQDIQCFRQCLLCSNYLFVYNEKVYAYAKEYHKKVYLFEANVNLLHFKPTIKKDTMCRIGFAGSESKRQYFQPAFSALQRLMEEREDILLYFKGIYLPLAFKEYTSRIHEENYVMSYRQYAEDVSKWGCDIMISPLEETAYTMGKCPNKYLEITAMGAVGVYSDTELYRKYVIHEKTGLLIRNTEACWYQTLNYLVDQKKLCRKIVEEARRDVEQYYTPQVLVTRFKKIMVQIHGEKSR